MSVSLKYGSSGNFSCAIDPARIVALRAAPAPLGDVEKRLHDALASPLDFPPFAQLCIPGDRVVLALDRHTPRAAQLVAGIWNVLAERGVAARNLLILQPAAWNGAPLPDPRSELPAAVANEVVWRVHESADHSQQAYLATTARGERIYLDRELVDADVVISAGQIAYDPVLGYRGTSSVFYPGLSNAAAASRAHGEGHSELGPDDERPLRQTIDEVAWLLGTQFTVQVVPSAGSGAAAVLAGSVDSVFRKGRKLLGEKWRVRLAERAAMVVAAVDADAGGHSWEQVAAALATARNLVTKGGRIVLLSELAAETDAGMKLIRESRSPRSALKPIRQQAPPDMIAATQLADAADWARVYLLSKLPGDVVDELFLVPLENEREVERVLQGDEPCVILESAQHVYGEIAPAGRKPSA